MQKWFWLTLSFFIFLNISSAFVLFFPSARMEVRNHITPKQPQLLSVVHGDLMHNGSAIKVVKFKTPNGIMLEFYSELQNGTRHLVSKVEMPNALDGFFDHRGQAVQLAIADLDGDGKMELLSPVFNELLQARLNPFHYSPEEGGFIPFIFSHSRP